MANTLLSLLRLIRLIGENEAPLSALANALSDDRLRAWLDDPLKRNLEQDPWEEDETQCHTTSLVDGMTPLSLSILLRNYDMTKLLLEVGGADPNSEVPLAQEDDSFSAEEEEEIEDEEGTDDLEERTAAQRRQIRTGPKPLFFHAIRVEDMRILELICTHPKFRQPSPVRFFDLYSAYQRRNLITEQSQLKILEYFPFLNVSPSAFKEQLVQWRNDTGSQAHAAPQATMADQPENEQSGEVVPDEESKEEQEASAIQQEPKDPNAPSFEDFQQYSQRTYGKANPERCGKGNPWVQYMFPEMCNAWRGRNIYGPKANMSNHTERVWCYERFGVSVTPLPCALFGEDDQAHASSGSRSRYVLIGGEHEDSYDPDFVIYNDIFVIDPVAKTYEMFLYPKDVFPPTDFHSATLVVVGAELPTCRKKVDDDAKVDSASSTDAELGVVGRKDVLLESYIYVMGSLGYAVEGEAVSPHIQVCRLNLRTMAMEQLTTTGDDPGRLSDHLAWLVDGGEEGQGQQQEREIHVAGGTRHGDKKREKMRHEYALNLHTLEWRLVGSFSSCRRRRKGKK